MPEEKKDALKRQPSARPQSPATHGNDAKSGKRTRSNGGEQAITDTARITSRLASEGVSDNTEREATASRTCLLVLGMHRSGTSAVARVLSIAGARLPKRLMGAGPGNEAGHWEPLSLIDYHERLLAELGSSWDDWRALDINRLGQARRRDIAIEIRDLVAADYGEAPLFVLKDPRICRFVHFFMTALGEADMDTAPLLVFRNPIEVAESLAARNGMRPIDAALLWLRHVLDAERATRDVTRVILSYADLLQDWRRSLARITETFGLDDLHDLDEIAPQVETYLSPEKRHHTAKTEDVLLDPLFREWVGAAYEALLVLTRNPDSGKASARLDRVAAAFDGAAPVLHGFFAEVRGKREGEIGGLRAVLTEREAEAGALTARLAEREGEVGGLRVELAEAESRIGEFEAALAEAQNGVTDLKAEITRQKKEADDLKNTMAERETIIETLKQAVEERKARIAEIEKIHQEAQSRAAELATTIVAHENQISSLERALSEATECVAELSAALEEREKKADDLKATLAEAQERHKTSKQVLARDKEALTAQIQDKETTLTAEQNKAAELERQIEATHQELQQTKASLALAEEWNEAYRNSTSWKMTRSIRETKKFFTGQRFFRNLFYLMSRNTFRATPLPKMLKQRLKVRDMKWPILKILDLRQKLRFQNQKNAIISNFSTDSRNLAFHGTTKIDRYEAWVRLNIINDKARDEINTKLHYYFNKTTKISVVTPVYNTDSDLLMKTINSVQEQIYSHWELLLVNDASSDNCTINTLREAQNIDRRIRQIQRERNGGISRATNDGVANATGDIIVFLDHDDLITEDALAEIALAYAINSDADIVYSDDDKIDLEGRRYDPQFKPDWSPTLLLNYMYISHLFSIRRDLFNKVGGCRSEFDGAQDHDLALRASEHAKAVLHIPKILYHWRAAPGSIAVTADSKPEAAEHGRLVVEHAFKRRGMDVPVIQPDWAAKTKLGIYQPQFSDNGPRVTIIIPTKNKKDILTRCIQSLNKTTYSNYDIIIIDNESDDTKTIAYLNTLSECDNIEVINIKSNSMVFNYAYINNQAARRTESDYIVFLNNDTEVISPNWLSQMIGYAQMENVGAVGAKLLFPNGNIQHGGVVHGYHNGLAGHAFKNLHSSQLGYLWYTRVAREYSAVTAACLLIKRILFEDLGGFDEDNFSVAYNDVDLCYKLLDRNLRCVYCGHVELIHHEGKSREKRDLPIEVANYRKRHAKRIDKYYNKNLSLSNELFEIRPRNATLTVRPVRAIMVTHNLNIEGAPKCMKELVIGLNNSGLLTPTIVSPRDGPLRQAYENHGINVIVLDPFLGLSLSREQETLEAFNRFGDFLSRFNPDIVYGNTLLSFWAIQSASMKNIPSVWNPRESFPPNPYFNYMPEHSRKYAFNSFSSAYKVVFVSNASRTIWDRWNFKHNFEVITDSLDCEYIKDMRLKHERAICRITLDIEEHESVFLLLGTVCNHKGQIDLVKAMRGLSDEDLNNSKFFIVGDRDNEYSKRLHCYVQTELSSHQRSRVVVVKETSDPYVYLGAADVAVGTSRVDTYPRVMLEAMAFGLPIITTPVNGIPEQVREGVNAVFYDPGNVDALTDHLSRLIRDISFRSYLSGNAIHVLEGLPQFSEMLSRYGEIFCEARLANI